MNKTIFFGKAHNKWALPFGRKGGTRLLLALLLLALAGCGMRQQATAAGADTEKAVGTAAAESSLGTLTVKLNFKRSTTIASNQYAVWIEDSKGQMVKTLFVTSFTAGGGYAERQDALSEWVSKANPASLPSGRLDAITGATPQTGPQQYVWDGTSDDGTAVAAGSYTVKVEGTLYWASHVVFAAKFDYGSSEPQTLVFKPSYSSSDKTNRGMIAGVEGVYRLN